MSSHTEECHKNNLLDHYPFPHFRTGVEKALDGIEAARLSGKRFIIVRAPTGVGKSAIAVAFARKYGAIVVAPTKLLQKQYAGTAEFDREYTVFGKSNYQCGLPGYTNLTVEDAICCSDKVAAHNAEFTPWADDDRIWKNPRPARALKGQCAQAGVCPYYSLIHSIERKPGAVLNYDLFAHLKKTPDGSSAGMELGTVVVMDEAHTLPDKVRSVYGYSITEARAARLLGNDVRRQSGEAPVAWLRRVFKTARDLLDKETDQRIASSLTKFSTRLEKFLAMELDDPTKFHIDDQRDVLDIKPLDLRFLKEMIFHPFECVLMMSATFPSNFCDLLGITENEKVEITIPSTFPAENRPVIYVDSCPVINWRTKLDEKHPSVIAMAEVLKNHANEKGIVHCANYRIFERLRELFYKEQRLLWVDREDDKSRLLDFHAASVKPTVLVSPAMMEGVDLKDDLARFQIMFKVPYGALDEYTRKMADLFKDYYENETITKIVQTYGRAVRSADDTAILYILDGAFKRMVGTHRRLFPQYFLEALSISRG